MRVAIRVDASAAAGTGHLIRCRTLAQALRKHGAAVTFICRAHEGHGMAMLRDEGFAVCSLPAPDVADTPSAEDENYARWLGVSQPQDAEETIAALPDQPDWLVVDHYGLDAEWERRLRPHVERILAIDDLANRDHDCDALLDQNYSRDAEARYRDRLPPHATRLLGPDYALLRPEYAQYRNALGPHSGRLERVFVFFGGTDPDNLTGRALEALSEPAFRGVAIDVVVGPNNPHREALAAQAEARPGTTLHAPRPHLGDLMAAADLAIGAGGTTTWERCCLGLPSLVVSIADNQRPACEAMADDGVIEWVGNGHEVSAADLAATLHSLRQRPEHLQRLAEASKRTVDGAGTERAANYLMAPEKTE
ncbi:UDP-2,4-diacetamido-2,4,6-trideoxy-beta-L-altropyranose hydrolase [Halorhodospira neutriphila]|uniref:UDP-2,4-diacetamido-2,4, 6-trideoxy-beta-L-altropyranose hydrolase n=1 Tax=Halorhodospira neutriphila TaxID=168379 RepID=A0ABS1E2W5_9GAMM|nr:UDP-2,4-diacetamido-2,4,6-trideoxy-beta-L-altropyranose hydrolase [Halorhodospira neutriphila]MBK1725452.1 UDP-2,4-diacetamido-2,4,6-trideoxy-beta-L-altropyranose hydrolase [Halorhodospira neutriphila]